MGGKQNVGFLIPSLYTLYMNFYWVGAQAEWIWRGELLWQGNGKISRPKFFPRFVLELLQDEKGKKSWTRRRRWVSCTPCASAWSSRPTAPSWSRWSTPKKENVTIFPTVSYVPICQDARYPCPCDGKWTKEAAYICPILNICTDFKTYTCHKILHRKIW